MVEARLVKTHYHGSTDTLQLLESMTTSSGESYELPQPATDNCLAAASSKEKLFREPELRGGYEEFRREVETELTRKDMQIEELTRKLSAQQQLLNRLALRLGLRDDDDL